METQALSGITRICERKAALMVEAGYVVDGVLVRRGGRLAIITNLGRVEHFVASEAGGIAAPYDGSLGECTT